MTTLAVGDELGGYRLEAIAGRGGMGVVYRATQIRLARLVALKVIAPELSTDQAFRTRFQREARLLAAVEHPHVIPVYEADEADGELFLSMRWVEGGDLAGEIAGTGGLEVERAGRLLAQVAGALDAVHACGLVHGDLKPANVLIEPRSGVEHAYLTDFGAGRQLEATASGQWLGTVDYVAPETIRGAPPDARSDRYGLACVLFEALTGAPPYHRDTAWATMWAHGNDPPPSACERRPALPAAVDAVLRRGLAKDPDTRYPSARQLLEALADALTAARGQATAAVPEPPPVGPGRSSALIPAPRSARRPLSRRAAALVLTRRRRFAALAGLLLAAGAAAAVGAVLATGSGAGKPSPAPVNITRTTLGAGTSPVGLTADATNAYALDAFGQYVDVAASGGSVNRIPLPGKPHSLVLDPTRKLLWVGLLSPSRLVAVSIDGQRVQGSAVALPIKPDLLAVLDDEVVIEQGNPAELVRIDARSARPIGTPVTPGGSATHLIAYHGSLLSTIVFPARLERFDASLRRLAVHSIPVALPTGMAVDSLGTLWVSDYDAARVWRLDPTDGAPEGPALPVGRDPTAVVASDDYIWVADAGEETLTMFNQTADALHGEPVPVGGSFVPIASNQDGVGGVWVASGTQLLSIDPRP